MSSGSVPGPTGSVRLVLASASPARRSTLERAGVVPTVHVSAVDEAAVARAAQDSTSTPADLALLLARAKCLDVAATLRHSSHTAAPAAVGVPDGAPPPTVTAPERVLVLGCDSVLEFEGEALGKPATADDAISRWRKMRGGRGVLHTGHWLVDLTTAESDGAGALASTSVTFAHLDEDEILAYVQTGEPLEVAGGFTIDGLGAAFVERIDGDHHNVVGLSVPLLRSMVRDIGISWPDLWAPRPPGAPMRWERTSE